MSSDLEIFLVVCLRGGCGSRERMLIFAVIVSRNEGWEEVL